MRTIQLTRGKTSGLRSCFQCLVFLRFFPSMVPVVMSGFDALNAMPEWYKGFLGAAVAASFGLRGLANWKK